jgi:hypothetical protein
MKKLLLPTVVAILFNTPLLAETVKGLYVSTPLAISGSFGIWMSDPSVGPAPLLETEVGLGGYKFIAGLENRSGSINTAVRAAYLHTWLEPVDLDTNQSYLGVEFQGGMKSLVGTIGGYRRVSGNDDAWIATMSLGVRF